MLNVLERELNAAVYGNDIVSFSASENEHSKKRFLKKNAVSGH